MAKKQKFGIKYPISGRNSETFIDLNESFIDKKESEIVHLLLTSKGTRLRDPDFGTDLIKYIFDANDMATENAIKDSVKESVRKYISGVELIDFEILEEEDNPSKKVLSIDFVADIGAYKERKNIKVEI